MQAIVHFGGAPLEKPWETILNANIIGSYNVYEAARKQGVPRVVYASSVHAIGYHRLEDHIDANSPHRPDSLYGLSKCFVEDLGRLYWDKFGIESVALRIFSSFPEPADRRMLWSWLSFMNPHQIVWGWAGGIPWAQITFLATVVGCVVNGEPKRLAVNGVTVMLLAFMACATLTTLSYRRTDRRCGPIGRGSSR